MLTFMEQEAERSVFLSEMIHSKIGDSLNNTFWIQFIFALKEKVKESRLEQVTYLVLRQLLIFLFVCF